MGHRLGSFKIHTKIKMFAACEENFTTTSLEKIVKKELWGKKVCANRFIIAFMTIVDIFSIVYCIKNSLGRYILFQIHQY